MTSPRRTEAEVAGTRRRRRRQRTGRGNRARPEHMKTRRPKREKKHARASVEKTTSRRLADRKTAKFQKNITRRGSVPETTIKKGNDYPLGPVVLGFFIFVVNGSRCFR
ncbi:hypothetical protein C2845_PM12G22450 [Panicum miliaceum]|uniref:Uncharacterized protein n=1 Tax=Panicum miliaceum TaxID=4540 RepID=A0A3L6QCJ2_PANMI|nr:hypothetical protein C2845_PM12G22450 [Panicum miliaceum]